MSESEDLVGDGTTAATPPSGPQIPEIVLHDRGRTMRYVHGEIVLIQGEGVRIPLAAVDRVEVDPARPKRVVVRLVGSTAGAGDYRYDHRNPAAVRVFVEAVGRAMAGFERSGTPVDGASLVSPVVDDQLGALRRRRIGQRLAKLVDTRKKIAVWLAVAVWVVGFGFTVSHTPGHGVPYVLLVFAGAILSAFLAAGAGYLRGRWRLRRRGITVVAYAVELPTGTYEFVDADGESRTRRFPDAWARSAKRPVAIEICYDPDDARTVRRRRLNPFQLFWASLGTVVGTAGLAVCVGIEIYLIFVS